MLKISCHKKDNNGVFDEGQNFNHEEQYQEYIWRNINI